MARERQPMRRWARRPPPVYGGVPMFWRRVTREGEQYPSRIHGFSYCVPGAYLVACHPWPLNRLIAWARKWWFDHRDAKPSDREMTGLLRGRIGELSKMLAKEQERRLNAETKARSWDLFQEQVDETEKWANENRTAYEAIHGKLEP